MDVVDILKTASYYCGIESELNDLFEYFKGNISRYDPQTGNIFASTTTLLVTIDPQTTKLFNKLTEAFNVALRSICTDKFVLKKEKEIDFKTNQYAVYMLSDMVKVYYVLRDGKKIPFKIKPDGILEIDKPGKVTLVYSYIPPKQNPLGNVDFLFGKVTDIVLALGTASEYLYMIGSFDEAEVIRKRYLEEADKIDNRRNIMPAKRWLK